MSDLRFVVFGLKDIAIPKSAGGSTVATAALALMGLGVAVGTKYGPKVVKAAGHFMDGYLGKAPAAVRRKRKSKAKPKARRKKTR